MEYLKIEQIAKNWNISVRRVQFLCADGKIERGCLGKTKKSPSNNKNNHLK